MDKEAREGFKEGLKVRYNGRTYDFGYFGETGKAIIYEEGERNMQDSIAVNLEELTDFLRLE